MPRNILIDPQRTGTNNPNIQFSGSMANTIRLEVLTSGSVQFTGVSGSLFSITDSLSGSLFAVSDVSGLPVLEVFSDDKVVAGRYGSNTLVVTGSQVGIGTNDPTGRRLFVVGTSTASDTVLTARAGTATPSGALLDLQNSSAASTFVVDYLGNLRAGTSGQGMVLDFRTNGSNRLDLRFSDSATWYINPDRSAASFVSFFENTLGGQVRIATRNADGSNTLRNGSVFTLDTRYWNGSANVVADTTIQALADATSPDYRMRLAAGTGQINIRSNGNVGVGVTNPGYALDVGGAIAIRGNETADNPRLYFQASDQSNRFTVESDLDATTGNDLLGFRSTSTDNILVLRGNGNVGIGVTSPTNILTINKGNGTGLNIQYDNSTNARTGLFLFTRGSSIGGFSGGSEWDDATTTARATAASTILASSGELVFYGNTGLTAGNTFTPTERARFNTSGHFVPGADNTYDLGLTGTKWRTIFVTNISGTLTPTGATAGSVFFAGVSGQITQDNSNFFWDDANNRLGIGTNVPQKSLEVITTASDYASVGVVGLNTNQWTGIHFGYRESNTNYRKSAIVFERLDSAARGKIHILNNHDFNAASATLTDARMTISSSGDVGIGGTGPTARLEVTGSTNTSAAATFHAINSAGTSLLYVRNDGPVGIGTGSPTSFFQVSSVSAGNFRLDNNASGGHYYQAETSPRLGIGRDLAYDSTQTASGYVSFTNGGGTVAATGAALAIIANRTLSLFTSNATALTPRMTIDGSGNVGIGLTNPSVKLHVIGSSVLADNTGIDPDTYTNAVVAGAISDTGWAVTSGIGGNAGTGDSWAIGHNGSALYFGIQDGTAANTMATFMQVSPSRNIGIGVAPVAGASTNNTLFLKNNGQISFAGQASYWDTNVYFGTSADRYVTNGYATRYSSVNGVQSWQYAGNGTAGNAISFTTGMRMDIGGNVGIGTVDANGNRLAISGGNLSVTGSVLPGATTSYDLGSTTYRWAELYARTGSFSGDVSIAGNLTVLGVQTYVSSTVVDIGDNIITLNSTANPQRYGGLYINDTTANTTGSLLWDSDNNYWIAGLKGSEAVVPTGTGTSGLVARWTGTTTLSTGVLYDNGTNVGVGAASDGTKMYVRYDNASSYTSTGFNTSTLHLRNGTGASDSPTMLSFSSAWSGAGWYLGLVEANTTNQANFVFQARTGASTTAERMRIDTSGNVGIGTTTSSGVRMIVSDNQGSGTARFHLANTNAQGGPLRIGYFPDSAGFHLTANGNPAHTNNPSNTVTRDYTNRATFEMLNILGSTLAGTYLDFRYALSSTFSPTVRFQGDGKVGIGTTDFTYTVSDNTPLVGSITNNIIYAGGSIQLNGNNDAIVFGRSTSTFIKDEELGFGWGSGWYMTDSTWLRTRNNGSLFVGGGGAYIAGNSGIGGTGTNFTSRLLITGSGATSSTSALHAVNSSGTSLFFVRDDGNVGIGTLNPAAKLDFGLTVSKDIITLYNNGTNNQYGFGISASTLELYTAQTGLMTFNRRSGASYAESMRIDSSGNVGIGTNNANGNKLAVNGQVSVTGSLLPGADNTYDLGSSSPQYRWRSLFATNISGTLTPTGATAGSVFFAGVSGQITQDNTNFFWDDSNNRLGIGTATPAQMLDLNGTFLQDKLWNSARQSISIALGTESWINLATIPNNCNVQFMYRIGSSNSEEEGTITILGTYYNTGTGETNITVNRQTYNEHLREVHVTQTAGGSNKTVYVKVRSNSSAPSLYWRIVMSQGGALNHTGDSVTINNTDVTATPPSGGKSLIVNGNSVYASTLNNIHYGSMSIGGGNSFSARLLVSGSGSGTTSSTMHLLNSSNTSLMFVRDDGFVGISTTAPAASSVKLQVGNAASLAQVTSMVLGGGADKAPVLSLLNSGNREGYVAQSTTALYIGNSSGLGGSYTDSNLASNAHVTISTGGLVGIGSTTPTAKLHVSDTSSGTTAILRNSDSGATLPTRTFLQMLGLYNNGSNGHQLHFHSTAESGVWEFNITKDWGGIVTIGASTDGTSRVRHLTVKDTGNVGVGTTNPTAKLTVIGSSTAATPTALVKEGVASPTGGALAFEVEKSNGSTIFAVSGSGFVGIGTSIPNATFEVVGVSGSLFSVTDQLSGSLFSVNTISGLPILEVFSDNTVVAGAYGTNALVVTGSRVGIGTNNPSEKLQLIGGNMFVSGTAGAGNATAYNASSFSRIIFNNDYSNTARGPNKITLYDSGWLGGFGIHGGTVGYYSGGAHAWYLATNATDAAERMKIDASGNVSIGNASSANTAQSQLHLMTTSGGDVPRLSFTNGTTGHTSGDGSFIGISNGTQLTVWNKESSEILFATNNIERMRIDSSGRSVWSTGPAGATASTTNGLQLWYDSTNNKGYIRATQEGVDHRDLVISGKSIDFWNQSGASRMFLDSVGNVGIGTTNANGNKLAVNGQVSVTGSLLPGADNLYDLGSPSYRWANFYVVNFAPTSVTAQLTGSNLTNGMVLFANATGGVTGSQSQFFWDNTNSRLGIGTSTPGQKLDVIGNVRASSTLLADAGAVIGTNTQSSLVSVVSNAAAGVYKGFGFQSAGSYRWYFTSNSTAEGGSNAGSDLEVRAYADAGTYLSSPLLIKRSTGNIGISTTSPGSRLTIGTDFASIAGVTIDTGNTSDSALIARRAASKPAFSILPWDNEVYIGSGIYYDTSWTHHSDSGYNQLLSLKPNTGVIWWSSDTGTASWNLANNILLWDPGARWKSSVQSTRAENSYFTGGFVGIGTASPSNLLHLYATSPVIRMQGSTDSAYLDYNNTRLQVSAGGGYLQVVTANTVRWITDLSGNVYPSTTDVGQLGTNTNQWIDVVSRRLSLGDNGVYVKSRGMILNAAAGTTGWRKVATLLVDANDWQSGKPFELLVRRYYSTGGFGNEYAKFVVSVDGYASTISTVFKGTYVEGFGAGISFAIQNFTSTGSGTTLYYTADVLVNVAQYLTYHVTINYSGAEFSSVQYPGATTGIVFGANYNTTQVAATGDIIQFTTPSLFFERGGLVGFGTTSVGSSILTAQSTAANWAGLTMKNSAGTTGGLIGLDAAGSGGGSTNMSVTAVGTLTFGSNNSAKASLDTSGNFLPNADNSQNIGSSTLRWANVHATNIISSGSLGPSYTTPTSTTPGSGTGNDGTAIFDTITLAPTTTPGALYELTVIANPNGNGNAYYRDIIYGKIIVGTGYNYSFAPSGRPELYVQFVNESPAPRSIYTSGGGDLTVDVVFLQGGSEYTSIPQSGGSGTIRVKIFGYYSGAAGAYIGANTTVRIKQLA